MADGIGWTPRDLLRHSYFEFTSVLAARMSRIKPQNTAMSEQQLDVLFSSIAANQDRKD